jgi:hypothetical protein
MEFPNKLKQTVQKHQFKVIVGVSALFLLFLGEVINKKFATYVADFNSENRPGMVVETLDQLSTNAEPASLKFIDIVFTIPNEYKDKDNPSEFSITVPKPKSKDEYIRSASIDQELEKTVKIRDTLYKVSIRGASGMYCPTEGEEQGDNCTKNESPFPNSHGLIIWRDGSQKAYAISTMDLVVSNYVTDVVMIERNQGLRFSPKEIEMWKNILQTTQAREK